MLISLALGTGCLALLAKSAADWAALAERYSEAANRGGMCTEGASHAADAGAAAGRAKDAASDADRAIGTGDALGHPADSRVLARVRQLADAAVPAYNAALEPLAAAEDDLGNASEEIGALLGLAALNPLGSLFWSALAADTLVCGTEGGSANGAECAQSELNEVVDEGIGDDLASARARLDVALGHIETAELELLQMRRAMDPEASSAALEAVQELRRKVASESIPEFYSNDDDRAEGRAYGVLHRAAEQIPLLIVGLQLTVEAEVARIAQIERGAGSAGTAIHDAEQTAREQAENARVAAEAALTACGVAFDWGLGDPLAVTHDQDLSNQNDYVIPSPGPPPPIPGP